MIRITTIILPWMVFFVLTLKAPTRYAFVVPKFSKLPSNLNPSPLIKFVPFAKFALAGAKIPASTSKSKEEKGEDGKLKGWEYLSINDAKKHNPKLTEDFTDNDGVMWHYICEGIEKKSGKKMYRRRRVVKMIGDDGKEKVYEVTEGELDWQEVDAKTMKGVTIDPTTGEAYVTDEDGNVWAYSVTDDPNPAEDIELYDVDAEDIAKYNPTLEGVVVDENGDKWTYFIDEDAMKNDGMEWLDVDENDIKKNNPNLQTVVVDENGEEWMYIEEAIE